MMSDIEDLKLKQRFLIKRANKVCKDYWSQRDLNKGKDVMFPWEYYEAALSVIPLYLEKGWLISKTAMLSSGPRMIVLNFRKPMEHW